MIDITMGESRSLSVCFAAEAACPRWLAWPVKASAIETSSKRQGKLCPSYQCIKSVVLRFLRDAGCEGVWAATSENLSCEVRRRTNQTVLGPQVHHRWQ